MRTKILLIFLTLLLLITCRLSSALDTDIFATTLTTTYLTGPMRLTVLNSAIKEELVLNYRKLTLPGSIKNKFSTSSTYFEIYFENNHFIKTEINSTPMLLHISLDNPENYAGINEIVSNKIIPLEYDLEDHELKTVIKNTGKYLITYTTSKPELVSSIINEQRLKSNRKNNSLWMLATIFQLLLAIILTLEIKQKES